LKINWSNFISNKIFKIQIPWSTITFLISQTVIMWMKIRINVNSALTYATYLWPSVVFILLKITRMRWHKTYWKQPIPRLISKMEIYLKNLSTRKDRDNYHRHKTLNNFVCGISTTVGAPGPIYPSFTDTQQMSFNSIWWTSIMLSRKWMSQLLFKIRRTHRNRGPPTGNSWASVNLSI